MCFECSEKSQNQPTNHLPPARDFRGDGLKRRVHQDRIPRTAAVLPVRVGKLGSWLDISMVEVPLCSGRLMGFIFLAENHLLTRSTTLCTASQQNESVDVRLGSKADVTLWDRDVRFTPKSGHWRASVGCPLCAKLGNTQVESLSEATPNTSAPVGLRNGLWGSLLWRRSLYLKAWLLDHRR
jgi:hypothetical protein